LVNDEVYNLSLFDEEVLLALQDLAHLDAIERLVALRSRRPYRRPTRCVQQPKLDPGRVRNLAHHTTERIYLADQVPFGYSSDRGIATHLRNQIEVQGEDRCAQTHPRRRHCGLASGVSGTDHHYVELFRKAHTSILGCPTDFLSSIAPFTSPL
jgi:hypothetical protein